MQNSASDILIYNSTGKLLNGKTDDNRYIGLPKQLDAKRNALYFESTEQGEIILGCSLRVVGSREERVVCIAVYNSGLAQEIVDSFYSSIKEAIKKLDKFNYKIIGLWEEGDLDTLKQVSVPEEIMQYVFGKIVAGEKVTIKSSYLAIGISLIKQISGYIGSLPTVKLVLSVSQYPVDNNVSISPKEPKPDFELDGADTTWKQIPAYKDYYLLLAKTIFGSPIDVKKYRSLNLKNLSIHIKNKAFQNYRDDILEMFIATPSSVNKFFELYINDEAAVYAFVLYWSDRSTQPLPVNDKLAGMLINLCSKEGDSFSSQLDYLNSEKESIKRIYDNIKSQEAKKAIDINLLKNKIFLSYVIKDTINKVYEDDIELLNALLNVSFSGSSSKKEKFKKHIDAVLSFSGDGFLVSLLKTIAINVNTEPSEGGKLFFESLILAISNKGYNFRNKLTKKEAENLETFFGTGFSIQRQQSSSNSTGPFLKIAALGAIVLLLIGAIVYFLAGPGIIGNFLNNSSSVGSLFGNLMGDDNKNTSNNSTPTAIPDFNPITVTFTDNTENATDWNWYFIENATTDQTIESDEVFGNATPKTSSSILICNFEVLGVSTESEDNVLLSGSKDTNYTIQFRATSDVPLALKFNGETEKWLLEENESINIVKNPTFTYTAPGTYDAILNVSINDIRYTLTIPEYIEVSDTQAE